MKEKLARLVDLLKKNTPTAYEASVLLQVGLEKGLEKGFGIQRLSPDGQVIIGDRIKFLASKKFQEYFAQLAPHIKKLAILLTNSPQSATVEDVYQNVLPELDNLYNQIKSLGMASFILPDRLDSELAGQGIIGKVAPKHEDFRSFETIIKRKLLPILMVCRDIPKFCSSLKEKRVLETIQSSKEKLLEYVRRDFHREIKLSLQKDINGFYKVSRVEPALVTQIKKILNALRHAELAIEFVNLLDINPVDGFKIESYLQGKGDKQIEFLCHFLWRGVLSHSTLGEHLDFDHNFSQEEEYFMAGLMAFVDHIQQAQVSLLEIDLPIFTLFDNEVQVSRDIIDSFYELSQSKFSELKVQHADLPEIARDKVGRSLGIVVDQLAPHAGRTDYSYLTHFAGALPSLLDQLTQMLQSVAAGKKTVTSSLDQEKINLLASSGTRLYIELDAMQTQPLFLKFPSIIPIFKEISTLSMASYEQMLNLNSASGEVVIYQLNKLKHELFVACLKEVDRIELYFGLRPGFLAAPLLQKMITFYSLMVNYGSSIVDLKTVRPDLIEFDNVSFLSARMNNIFAEMVRCKFQINQAEGAKEALSHFLICIKKYQSTTDLLCRLSKEEKSELTSYYHQFQPMLIDFLPSLSVSIESALSKDIMSVDVYDVQNEMTLNQLCSMSDQLQREIVHRCDTQIATYDFYLQLAKTVLQESPKQLKGKLFKLDPQISRSFLMIDESSVTEHKRAKVKLPAVSVRQVERHLFVENIHKLDINYARSIYEYHESRIMTLNHIQSMLPAFTNLLVNIRENNGANGKGWSTIKTMYFVLQPYLVDSLPENDPDDIDAKLVAALNHPKSIGDIPYGALTVAIASLEQKLKEEVNRSVSRKVIFQEGYEACKLKTNLVMLSESDELVVRQNKWLPQTRLTKAISKLEDSLFSTLNLLDPCFSMNGLRQTSNNSVPFQEMEDDIESLKVPAQLSWIKRMINVVHYLHRNFAYLESLDRDIEHTDWTMHLLNGPIVKAINFVTPYMEIVKAYQTFIELSQEPQAHLLMNSLMDDYHAVVQAWAKISPLYTVGASEVLKDDKTPVEKGGIWYPMLSFLVIPEHFQALADGKQYGRMEVKKTQERAKIISQQIEKLIKQYQESGKLGLFLSSPRIFGLLYDLRLELKYFKRTTHSAITAHLDSIQACIQKILIETDRWELDVGLASGTISKPVKIILDNFFIGFIEPLGLSADKVCALLQDSKSFDKRIDKLNQKLAQNERVLDEEKQLSAGLEKLEKLMSRPSASLSSLEQDELSQLLWDYYPQLYAKQERFAIAMDQRDKSVALDKLCNNLLIQHTAVEQKKGRFITRPPLVDVLYLVKHVHAEKVGHINTVNLRIAQLQRKKQQLDEEKAVFIEKDSLQYKEQYISRLIGLQINFICHHANQVTHLNQEYNKLLKAKLKTANTSILQKAMGVNEADIKNTISAGLDAVLADFANEPHVQLYQLQCIADEANKFLAYCQQELTHPTFETVETVTPKIKLLKRLTNVACDESLQQLADRLKMLQDMAGSSDFAETLLCHRPKFASNFKTFLRTLKRLFLNLVHPILRFLGISVRSDDYYESLQRSVTSDYKYSSAELLSRVGKFRDAHRGYGLLGEEDLDDAASLEGDSSEPTV